MLDQQLIAAVRAAQTATGAFAATVHLADGPLPDDTCFVTALVLRELADLPERAPLQPTIERALDFLLRCESPTLPGAFHFYPPAAHPGWIGRRLPADADDTAVATLALVGYGRWPADRLRRAVAETLDAFRLHYRPPHAQPWIRSGVWMTWLEHGERTRGNPIDCCVNLNLLTLLRAAGWIDHPAYRPICQMVAAGLDLVGSSEAGARLLTPYYPHPAELLAALHTAVRAGAVELAPALHALELHPWATVDQREGWPPHRPIFSSRDGQTIWTSSALQTIRRLAHHARARGGDAGSIGSSPTREDAPWNVNS